MSTLEIILSGLTTMLLALGAKDILSKKITSKKEEVENESFAIKTMKEVMITQGQTYLDTILGLKTDLSEVKTRLDKVEERERHALTRAAVHEAWDQMSFQALLSMNPEHPPPPPLIIREVIPAHERQDN